MFFLKNEAGDKNNAKTIWPLSRAKKNSITKKPKKASGKCRINMVTGYCFLCCPGKL